MQSLSTKREDTSINYSHAAMLLRIRATGHHWKRCSDTHGRSTWCREKMTPKEYLSRFCEKRAKMISHIAGEKLHRQRDGSQVETHRTMPAHSKSVSISTWAKLIQMLDALPDDERTALLQSI